MKHYVLTAIFVAALVGLPETGSTAAQTCVSADKIKSAFEPRLSHEIERAREAGGPSGDTVAANIRSGFERLDVENTECEALYNRFRTYVEDVISRNDRLAHRTSRTRGLFQKW